jgi:hypothetical protein
MPGNRAGLRAGMMPEENPQNDSQIETNPLSGKDLSTN